jgi:hypothetical protein
LEKELECRKVQVRGWSREWLVVQPHAWLPEVAENVWPEVPQEPDVLPEEAARF